MRRSRSSARLLALVLGGVAVYGAGASRSLRAQAITQAQGAEFLLLPVGARATALGQAATADGGTTEAIFWNPAGLAALTRGEFAVHHYNAFFGTGDAIALAIHNASLGTFAIAAYLVNYGDLDLTARDGSGAPIGRISPRNLALSATYATDVFDAEPPHNLDLARHPRVIATSHIGGFTVESVERATMAAISNLLVALIPGHAD